MAEVETKLFPALDEDLKPVEAPVQTVTLLEDRAQVQRKGTLKLEKGRNRIVVMDVAPVMHSVSLRAEVQSGKARVADVRVRRAQRVRVEHKPEDARALEVELDKLAQEFVEVSEDRARHEARYAVVLDMLAKGADEIPDDAAWGIVNHQVWHDTFESLFKRARNLQANALDAYFAQTDLAAKAGRIASERTAMDRPDAHFVAWIEADVDVEEAGNVEVVFEYVVPNALWRPLHSATLSEEQLTFRSSAVVWQNTGEDWKDVDLVFSTARSSLGTEAPLLSDDLVRAQPKAEEVVVAQREVAIQKAAVKGEGGAPPSSGVDLPGVDDGGDVQNLRAARNTTILSDGRPNIVPIFSFSERAAQQLVCMPELSSSVFLKSTQTNGAKYPILAGPVELIRDAGFVGWSSVLFVAPGETFELGFGPDDALRVLRDTSNRSKKDAVDKWNVTTTRTDLYLSNLEGAKKVVKITERIPVAEIEHVRVKLVEKECQPKPELDNDGLCTWTIDLEAHSQNRIHLRWEVGFAPDVQVA